MARLADIDKLLEKQFFSLDDDGFGMMVVSVTDIISAPTVERKRGRWNEINPTTGLPWKVRCDQCGCPQDYRHNFCPNCGADMRGDGDGR